MYYFFQSMVTGDSGANGTPVRRRANRESNQEHVNATHPLPSMLEKFAQANDTIFVCAMITFHVQVNYSLVCIVAIHLRIRFPNLEYENEPHIWY